MNLAMLTRRTGGKPRPFELFPRKQIHTMQQKRGDLDRVAKALRQDAWKSQESHNKQVQMFVDRARFSQNATWQTEYDRLNSAPNSAAMQPYVDNRLIVLKTMLSNK